ncbi:hypothetical protein [Streptomyces abikoensis]|uniref:hypothetical protein n=1 Tax=Streptomyces abikoensis TaxID=97398 RepID=UPI001674078E|nr:hypothetical protein [Streptomyces abikoensis]GGP72265.1 hypothetical protein GCM10010214_53930 [Streptomyces abikoensis]
MTTAAAVQALASQAIPDNTPVFGGRRNLIPGVVIPLFGQTRNWPGDCLRRPANRVKSAWQASFPTDPIWNLRTREVAFGMLNSSHKILRDAGLFFQAENWGLSSVKETCDKMRLIAKWAVRHQMPHDLAAWAAEDWQDYLDYHALTSGPSTLANDIVIIRRLLDFAPLLTGGGLLEDPWPGRSATEVAEKTSTRDLSTPSIPPAIWWPLLRAAWFYIDEMAPQILERRDQHAAAVTAAAGSRRQNNRTRDLDAKLAAWVQDPASLVPVHARDYRGYQAGTVMWSTLSLWLTDGASSGMFKAGRVSDRHEMRRTMVQRLVDAGRVRPITAMEGRAALGEIARPARRRNRRPDDLDEQVQQWLADPANRIPVRRETSTHGPAGEPVWLTLESRMFGSVARANIFTSGTARSRRRQQWVREAITEDRTDYIEDGDLEQALRMVRAACYIFIAALTLMRDSELQEIERDSVVEFFGSPAIASRKVKHDESRPRLKWWIIEPVAQAVAVAERLSWHDSHIFATLAPPSGFLPEGTRGRAGFDAFRDIDFFIENINNTVDRTGLESIPAGLVRPHMFRKTMAIITGQQPDGEIALGIQLKHAARRALANRVTAGYGKMDAHWAKEFDNQLELAAARKLVELLKARRQGEPVAVGPGAARLHAGLDKVITTMDNDPVLQAQVADERMQVSLLRDEFAQLHFGTINHCLWQASTAECQNQLPPEQRGQQPLLGACQPGKCRNSVLTLKNAPYWIAEEGDLQDTLSRERLSPPRRESLELRLAEVRSITAQFATLEADH